MEWKEFFQLVIDLAFVEAGRAILWMLLGGLAGTVLAILILVVGKVSLRRSFFQDSDQWGKWSLRILLVVLGISLVPLLAVGGGTWGLIVAAEKTVEDQQLVEKTAQESFGLVIAQLISEIETEEEESEESITSRYLDENQVVNLELVRAEVSKGEEVFFREAERYLIGEKNVALQKAPLWFRGFVEKLVKEYFETSRAGQLFEGVEEVLADAEQRKGVGKVTIDDLSWSLGAIHLRPQAAKFARDLRMAVLVGAVIQAGILIFGHLAIAALVLFAARKLSPKKEEFAR